MKALSLWQPWASLWLSPRKKHETRHWPIKHRGWLLVHAARRIEPDVDPDLAALLRADYGAGWAGTLPTGALLGMVNIINCRRTEVIRQESNNWEDWLCGNFAPERYGFERGEYRVFEKPIPYRGQQGLFPVPDEVIVREATWTEKS